MQFRWWNSFNLLAVILLAIGITGAIEGPKMVFDPGRQASGFEWVLYVVAGALMLVNGLLPPSNPVDEEEAKSAAESRKPQAAAAAAVSDSSSQPSGKSADPE